MSAKYTVIEEEPVATTDLGERFDSFDEANDYAYDWAQSQWPDVVKAKNDNGIYEVNGTVIYVEEV